MRRWTLGLLSALAVMLAAAPATAQYFGRNKVVYDEFEWRVLQTPHFDVHFYPEEEAATREAARGAERWNWRLEQVFRHRLTERKPIVMYESHPDFQQTNVDPGQISQGVGGFTDPLRNRAVQPFTGTMHESLHVIGHELAHVFQFDIASAQGSFGLQGMSRMPLWLIEGMAEYLSVGRVDPHTAMWLRDAALRGDIPTIEDLSTNRRYFPYRYGQALMAYVGGRWGDKAVTELYRVGARQGLGPGIKAVTGLTPEQLSREWSESIRLTYLPLIEGRLPPQRVGRDVFAEDPESGDLNVAPVLSPDGRRVAFLSERKLFSIELFVADVETGEVVAELTDFAGQPHFDALSFLNAAGAWSPDGRQFAFVVVDEGDNEIHVADVEREKTVREIEIPGVDGLNDPTWSPDGRRLAFTGATGGINDLYLFDLGSGQVTQLTSGLNAEMQPDWSPDGRTLVFATDRGPGTDLRSLVFSPLRLATLDVESREIRLLPSFDGAKHINPQFSPDGRDVYFISDRDGVSDVFRLELASGALFRVTNVATGISGITSLSPALSVADQSGRLAFSIFKDNRYTLHTLTAEEARGVPVTGPGTLVPAAALPPVLAAGEPGESVVSEYLRSPLGGLPTEPEFGLSDYDPDLDLEYIGTPSVGVGVDRFGTAVGGATSFFFRDLLGNRTLAAAVQAQGSLKDIGGQAMYVNREKRWNWGLLAGHIPLLSGRRLIGTDPETGLLRVSDILYRVFVDQAGAQIAYPFSTTRRFEANASFMHLGYDLDARVFLCNPSGTACQETSPGEFQGDLDALTPEGLSVARAALAYVGDWSTFAFTGPVAGGRYRFEVEPTFGGLQYVTGLADYRRYLFLNPMTIAARGLHYGRYGEDADNQRFLTPLFLGYDSFVRGYEIESFDATECAGGGSGCPAFDRLIGSKIAVANFELRVPLLGVPEFGLINFPFLPTDAGVFFDAGVAWTGDDEPSFEFARQSTERVPVASAGLFARSNLLGYIVLETWLAYPFQRPGVGWQLGFNLAPGW